jgi:CheY-like chemotaxis protein
VTCPCRHGSREASCRCIGDNAPAGTRGENAGKLPDGFQHGKNYMNTGGILLSGDAHARHAASRPAPDGSTGHASAQRALRVLVADDDRDSVLTLMMLLREEGHEARGVYSGRQVMGHVLDFDPDVVLLDIAMPELSGWEVARTIRARRGAERPLLIGISGEYKQGADRVLAQILGFNHYFVKPYAPADLLALLAPPRDRGARG